MRYICVQWIHFHPDEPVEIYSESDRDGWETRKIEVFRDGTTSYADSAHSTGTSQLATIPMATVEETNSEAQFRAKKIGKHEFEELWTRVTGQNERIL
jgi:hypothetical protein